MKQKLYFIPIFSIIFLMILFGSIYDFQINMAIYDSKNIFGLTMAAVGEAPGYASIGLFGGGFFFLGLKRYKENWQKILLIALGVVSLIIAVYFQGKHVIDENAFNIEKEWWAWPFVALPVGLLIGGFGFGVGYFLSKTSDNPELLKMFIIIAAIALLSVAITTLLKNIMLRPRYRWISDHASSDDFRNWWEQGTYNPLYDKEEFKSFPSGHATSTAICLVTLTYLPMFKSKWMESKIVQPVLLLIGVVWTLLLCFSRMLVGAHYLSDVGFGFAIVAIIFFVADWTFYQKKKIKPIDA